MSVFRFLPDTNIYFSKSFGVSVYNSINIKLGTLVDFFVAIEETYPEVIALLFKKNNQYFYAGWDCIKYFSYKKIILKDYAELRQGKLFPKINEAKIKSSLLNKSYDYQTIDYPPLGRMVLDRQIVDTHGKKVVRVNDICFMKVGNKLKTIHAGIGLKSMMRRLGFNSLLEKIPLKKWQIFFNSEKVINWKFVRAVPDKSFQRNLKLSLSNEDIKDLHPADLADILEDLDAHGRQKIFQQLDPEKAAETLVEVEQDMQQSLLSEESPDKLAQIVENMGPDEAADLLNEMDLEEAQEIISKIKDDDHQEEIQELLSYEDDSAGGIMSTEHLYVSEDLTKNQLLEFIKINHEEYETVYDIYIVDKDEILLGTTTLKNVIAQSENLQLKDFMRTKDIKSVTPNTQWEEVAQLMSKYDLLNIPVLDEKKELLGIVSVDDILPWLLDEK